MKTHDSAEVIALTPASSAVREVRVTTTERRVKKSIGGREVKASGPRGANGRKFIKALVTMHTKEIDSDRLNCIVKTDQLGSLFATLRPLRRRSGVFVVWSVSDDVRLW